jgi:hypothetical protein
MSRSHRRGSGRRSLAPLGGCSLAPPLFILLGGREALEHDAGQHAARDAFALVDG